MDHDRLGVLVPIVGRASNERPAISIVLLTRISVLLIAILLYCLAYARFSLFSCVILSVQHYRWLWRIS